MSSPVLLRIAIGNCGQVKPLKDGSVASERLRLEFVEVDPLPNAFRQMLRERRFDVCEMALATHALAHRFGKPVTALPIILHRGFHHAALACAMASRLPGPAALAGGRIGVRSYSQTTGVWVRGILATQYGIAPEAVTWAVLEDSHVPEFRDPPNVERAAAGKTLGGLLKSGEVDAVIGFRNAAPGDVRTVTPDAESAAADWYRKTAVYPANHVVVVANELLAAHPWLAAELLALFEQAKAQAYKEGAVDWRRAQPILPEGTDPLPYGIAANRAPIEMLLDFCTKQRLTERTYRIEELFDRGTLA